MKLKKTKRNHSMDCSTHNALVEVLLLNGAVRHNHCPHSQQKSNRMQMRPTHCSHTARKLFNATKRKVCSTLKSSACAMQINATQLRTIPNYPNYPKSRWIVCLSTVKELDRTRNVSATVFARDNSVFFVSSVNN